MTGETWAEIRDRLAVEESAEMREVAAEARAAEEEVAELEEKLRSGGDVKPGEIEAAEARGRHARLRLEAVQRKHAGAREDARLAHRQQVHDELTAFCAHEDDTVIKVWKAIAENVAKLAEVVPPRNAALARLRAEVAAVDTANDTADLGINRQLRSRPRVMVDGRLVPEWDVAELLRGAIDEGMGGDPRQRAAVAEALGRRVYLSGGVGAFFDPTAA